MEIISNLLINYDLASLFTLIELSEMIKTSKDSTVRIPSPKETYLVASHRIQSNLHILMCFDSNSFRFQKRNRQFLHLLNNCQMIWVRSWSSDAYHSIAFHYIKDVETNRDQSLALEQICVTIHGSVEDARQREELNLHIGPSLFRDLLSCTCTHLSRRSDVLDGQRTRITNGLNKILNANKMAVVMQEELKTLTPKVEIQSKEIERLIHRLANDTKIAEDFRVKVLQEEAEAKEKEIIMRAIADDANCDLEVATPALKMAQEALKAINKNDLNELKAMTAPPPLVMFVLEAVCVLVGIKPAWDSAKKLLSDPSFPKKLMEFEKEQISEVTMKKIKTYIEHKDFDPLKIEVVSRVAKLLSLWISAMDKYAVVYKIVEPKIMKARSAENDLKEVNLGRKLATWAFLFIYYIILDYGCAETKASKSSGSRGRYPTIER